MRVSAIDANGDWVFGRGRASYKTKSEAIKQKVITAMRSFTDDFFLDTNHGSPWFEIFGSLGNKDIILREVQKVALTTNGVRSIDSLTLLSETGRSARVSFSYTDIFNTQFKDEVKVSI